MASLDASLSSDQRDLTQQLKTAQRQIHQFRRVRLIVS
jgi:hypothetical protein